MDLKGFINGLAGIGGKRVDEYVVMLSISAQGSSHRCTRRPRHLAVRTAPARRRAAQAYRTAAVSIPAPPAPQIVLSVPVHS